ncbi:MAG: hypothetical protein J5671_09905 [Bacteroidaceae bacterium]|nr:hypothetical protein [Bacteroidaceae bacterium]
MKKILFILSMCSLLLGCSKVEKKQKEFLLQGVWTARHGEFPTGETWDYPTENGNIFCRIFDGDSMTYKCRLSVTGGSMVVLPLEKCEVTLINKGRNDILYLEDGDPHPLTIINDSTIIIQKNGVRNTWVRDDKMTQEWGAEMRDLIASELDSKGESEVRHYVLSSIERQQESTIHQFVYTLLGLVFVLMILAQRAFASQRSKRRLQRQLQQIQEEHDTRPQPIRQAMMEVEQAFFVSDEYAFLHKRIANGEHLKEEDWEEVERQLKLVYPGFTSKLRSLYRMSELEYQVCLLIKLRIAPKDIANILFRDVSTISTVRSRLYQKVFGHKGGAKEWDEFILKIES